MAVFIALIIAAAYRFCLRAALAPSARQHNAPLALTVAYRIVRVSAKMALTGRGIASATTANWRCVKAWQATSGSRR